MRTEARDRLDAVLERELDVAQQLTLTLHDERAALTGASPEAVVEQAARKVAWLGRLEQLETERRELCQAAGIRLPPEGQGTPAAAAPVARWLSLMELMARCRAANEVNGYIINVRRTQVGQLIDIVRGARPGGTYGPEGRTSPKALRALARA